MAPKWRLPDSSTILAAEATAISLALNYYQHIGPVHHDVVVSPYALFAGNGGWRHRQPFYLPYHEPALVTEWQGHKCSFLLETEPLWHWGKWKDGPTSKKDPQPRYRPTGKCPLYRYEAIGGYRCTWQRSISRETNTGATEGIPELKRLLSPDFELAIRRSPNPIPCP